MRPELLDGLNPEQREAAICETHCLTVAAPGSGKTKMLSAKAAFLLSGGATVVAVTFTRDAAIELRDRIVRQAGQEVLDRLLVGTFHSIDLLMAFPAKARSAMGSAILAKARSKLSAPWKIVRDGNRRSAVARAIDVAGLPGLEIDDATSLIEKLKSGAATPKDPRESALVQAYTDLLQRHGVIDFQDILLKTNEGLTNGDITPLATNYLLLDEFQDTDLAQYEWAMAHAKAGSIVTAVGDDDQSIYGFRRALGYEGMQMFAQHTRAVRVVLGTNYRSHAEVLTCAGRLIGVNAERMDKALVSHKGVGGSAMWERFAGRQLEAAACAKAAGEAVKNGMTFGVLARTNARLESVEAEMHAEGVDYVRTGGDSLLNTREVAVMVATFTSLWKPTAKDTDELLAWCGVDEDDLREIHRCFGDMLPAKISRQAMGKGAFKESTKEVLKQLVKASDPWHAYLATGGIRTLVTQVTEFLSAKAVGDPRSKRVLEVAAGMFWRDLASSASANAGAAEPTEQIWQRRGRSFAQRVADIRAAMRGAGGAAEQKDAARQPKVTLMTAHASKGLEFDQVWIVGAEEDAFPDKDSGLQEERRLMYVAMTRARKNLWVSAPGKKAVSRFIEESGMARAPTGTFVTEPDSGQGAKG